MAAGDVYLDNVDFAGIENIIIRAQSVIFGSGGEAAGIDTINVSGGSLTVSALDGVIFKNYSKLIDNIPGGVAILHESDGVFYLDFANDGFTVLVVDVGLPGMSGIELVRALRGRRAPDHGR